MIRRADTSCSGVLPLFVSGEVCTGFGRGSKELGMPTANYSSDVVRNLPPSLPNGVYCGWAQVESEPVRMMVMSVGWNPFYNNTEKTMEIHILHEFERQFYGSTMRVCVVMNMRDELNFSSVDELIETIKDDIAFARAKLSLPELVKYKDSDYFVAPLDPNSTR